ncbi:MAG TPA: beta-ketoacyl synthase N-terminal-like domain-containing protein [Opitutus sp.]|nr:beta-ketoacyl synthase N-terminal-like domain-containing protein [Opitutus sp.]
MKRRRVKITGVGPVTPAGVGREEFWKGILEPVSRVRPFTALGEQNGPLAAAFLSKFDIRKFVPDRGLVPNGAGRHTLFAIAGAILALRDAGVSVEELRQSPAAIVTGSSLMDFGSIGSTIEAVQKRGPRAAQPRTIYSMGISSVPSAINQSLGLNARTMAVSTQCSAGLDAIGYAVDLVATCEAEIALCGGTDAPLRQFPMLEFRAASLTPATIEMAARLCRPFDLWRTTGVVSEGACMLVVEPESSPRRGYSFISGYAFANDDDTLCSGIAAANRLAIAEAGLKAGDVDLISAWGPGHKKIDAAEAQALSAVFGAGLQEIPVVAVTGALGTALGGAPAIQVGMSALAQQSEQIPPTVNWEFPDPDCPLNLSSAVRFVRHQTTLINAHGAGGVNASMILERC